MIIEKVTFKNFLSFGNIETEFPIDDKTTLLVGGNGEGKSTLIDVICFVFFNRAYRDINLSELINNINLKDCVASVEFSSKGNKYKIIRGLKPKLLKVFENGNLVKEPASGYQDYIQSLLGISFTYKTLIQTHILSPASYIPFLKLKTLERRNIIEDLLNVQIFSVMNDLLKKKVKTNKEELQLVDNRISINKEKILLQEENEENSKLKNDVIISSNRQTIIDDNNLLDEYKTKLYNLQCKDVNTKRTEKQEIDSQKAKLLETISKLNIKSSNIKKDNEFYHDKETCPTCLQNITHEFKEVKLINNKNELDEIQQKLDKFNKILIKMNDKLKLLNDEISEIEEYNTNIRIEESNCKINIKNINNNIERLIKETSKLETPVDFDNSRLQELKKEQIENINIKDKLEEDKTYFQYSAQCLKDDGIKSKIVKTYIPILNKLINKSLSDLGLFYSINIDENFNEIVKERHVKEISYNGLSEGQKKRIDLAILFAFMELAKVKNSINTNLLIFDEVFDGSLDNNGVNSLIEILSKMQDKNVIVISHSNSDIYTDVFNKTLEFKKIKNFTQIKEV